MAKVAAKAANFAFNSVALEDDLNSINMDVRQELPVVTSFADAGPRRVVGNYDYSFSVEGVADFAASQSDATLFAQIGGAGAAVAYDPTGATAGTDDPNFDATSVMLESYSVKSQVGGATTLSATLQGNAALARAVA